VAATRAQVNGLWFYQQEECDAMTALLQRCARVRSVVISHDSVSRYGACALC
jgi:hypothetical protein